MSVTYGWWFAAGLVACIWWAPVLCALFGWV